MKKIAVFPGSFDPITLGHESLVLRALPLFDEIIIAIGINTLKTYFFPLEKRRSWIEKVFKDYPKIKITTYKGLTVDYCRKVNAQYILRGLRTSADFEFERSVGQVNKKLYPEIETVFLLTTPELTAVTSSVIRDVVRNNGDASQFVPKGVDLTI
ncbi:MAG: pantetheine-phosphate adenylyltransferase [Bacteroidales bacterium]|jgi:pantetheine-phosphate adenylyltransferase|nr:pantetheine-phosphate adenylyltransferase [Bacteroidales bacterium]MDN5348816.1 pantetheine-phosphate adenylyltransferase [Bacteroidales bacterium]